MEKRFFRTEGAEIHKYYTLPLPISLTFDSSSLLLPSNNTYCWRISASSTSFIKRISTRCSLHVKIWLLGMKGKENLRKIPFSSEQLDMLVSFTFEQLRSLHFEKKTRNPVACWTTKNILYICVMCVCVYHLTESLFFSKWNLMLSSCYSLCDASNVNE